MNPKHLVAHRGYNAKYPENSYAGLEAALQAGSLYVEFDVQMNADQSLVVFHDTDFKRTADSDGQLFAMNNAALSAISVHEPARFGEQFKPTAVPSLDQVLALLSRYPKAQAFVEVKRESLMQWGVSHYMDAFLHALKNHSAQCIVISFSQNALSYTRLFSDLRTGFVFHNYLFSSLQTAQVIQPDFMICAYHIIPSQPLWEGDWQWMVYSINSVAQAIELLKRGDIDFIETDDIGLLLAE